MTTNKMDWQYAFLEKLKAAKLRKLMAERAVIIDGKIESQIEQLTSAGFPSWSLYNSTRRYLLGAVSTSITFGYLKYDGTYEDLLSELREYLEESSYNEQPGPSISRAFRDGSGPSTHLIVDYSYRVDKLGSDLSLTRDQRISNSYKIKKVDDEGYIFWCHPKTRFDLKQILHIMNEISKKDKSLTTQVLPYAPCPTTRNSSKHFVKIGDTNSFFLELFMNGFLQFNCQDVFKADTFEWNNGFEFTPRTGDELLRDRSEVIRRIRVEGEQLNLDSGRINEIIGQGHAIHNFGATFIYNTNTHSLQLPIEYRFTSKPLGTSIIGGPLLFKAAQDEWIQYPGTEVTERLLLSALEILLRRIHNRIEISLPNAIHNIREIPIS